MRNRYLLSLFVTLFSYMCFSQTQFVESLCGKNYNILLQEENMHGLSYEDVFVNFKWDKDKINLSFSESDKIQLEIVPIMDCFNGINGSDLKKGIIVDLKKKSKEGIDILKVKHKDLMAKCFKWRIRSINSSCSEISTWKYHLFIK